MTEKLLTELTDELWLAIDTPGREEFILRIGRVTGIYLRENSLSDDSDLEKLFNCFYTGEKKKLLEDLRELAFIVYKKWSLELSEKNLP